MDLKKPENIKGRRFSALCESYELLKRGGQWLKRGGQSNMRKYWRVKSQLGGKQFQFFVDNEVYSVGINAFERGI